MTEIQEQKHLALSEYLNQFYGIIAILKALQGLASKGFTPGLQLPRQFNYTKYLVSDVVCNAQNGALKKKAEVGLKSYPGMRV